MDGQMKLDPDFKEFIQLLNGNNVRYLVVGGYAVAIYGHPRYTKDLDIWLWIDSRNAHQVVKTLEQFGFGSLELSAEDFADPNQVIQLGYPPNRIDLLTSVSGIDFDECYPQRCPIEVDDVMVDFIDLENLKKNKRSSGRMQDLADLENLK